MIYKSYSKMMQTGSIIIPRGIGHLSSFIGLFSRFPVFVGDFLSEIFYRRFVPVLILECVYLRFYCIPIAQWLRVSVL